jgi:hypothetical protein
VNGMCFIAITISINAKDEVEAFVIGNREQKNLPGCVDQNQ